MVIFYKASESMRAKNDLLRLFQLLRRNSNLEDQLSYRQEAAIVFLDDQITEYVEAHQDDEKTLCLAFQQAAQFLKNKLAGKNITLIRSYEIAKAQGIAPGIFKKNLGTLTFGLINQLVREIKMSEKEVPIISVQHNLIKCQRM